MSTALAGSSPWSALDAQRAQKAAASAPASHVAAAPDATQPAAAAPAADEAAKRTLRFGNTAAGTKGSTRPLSAPDRRATPLAERRQPRDAPPGAGAHRQGAHLDFEKWAGTKPATGGRGRQGWSSFGVQTVSQRPTAAMAAFPTGPRVPVWLQNAERRRSEPGPADHASGVLRFHGVGQEAARRDGAGTAAARRQPPLPTGHFRHAPDPEGGYVHVPYPLLHVRPIRGGLGGAAPARGPHAKSAGGARTFGTARRETAMAVPFGAGRKQPRALYYVPTTR